MRRRSKYGLRTVDTARNQGLDDEDGRWVVICDDHHTIANVRTKAFAANCATTEFCDDCRETA